MTLHSAGRRGEGISHLACNPNSLTANSSMAAAVLLPRRKQPDGLLVLLPQGVLVIRGALHPPVLALDLIGCTGAHCASELLKQKSQGYVGDWELLRERKKKQLYGGRGCRTGWTQSVECRCLDKLGPMRRCADRFAPLMGFGFACVYLPPRQKKRRRQTESPFFNRP